MTDSRRDDADLLRYRRVQTVATAIPLLAFAIGSAAQANLLTLGGESVPQVAVIGVTERLTANLLACGVLLAALVLFPARRHPWPAKIVLLLGIGLLGALTRSGFQLLLGVHEVERLDRLLLDLPAAAVTTAISLGLGLAAAEVDARLLTQERVGAAQAIRATTALQRLQAEELRVRRVVAEGLHGTVQQRLVLVETQLRTVRESWGSGRAVTPDDLTRLDALLAEVTSLREQDVRGYSQMLYPSGVDMGLAQAIRILFRRLAATIAVTVRIDESVVRADDPGTAPLSVEHRILAIRVLEEGVTNALRHGHAGTLDVVVEVDADGVLAIALDDDGGGLGDTDRSSWSGLAALDERLTAEGGTLTLGPSALGGTRLAVRLPLVYRTPRS